MNNKSVSAVIGIILLVAITVAIASTVYVYVSHVYDTHVYDTENNIIKQNISGNITEKFRTNTDTLYYYFVIDNSFDVSINESNFYKYNVGDYYE
jgi:flagellin-like protein